MLWSVEGWYYIDIYNTFQYNVKFLNLSLPPGRVVRILRAGWGQSPVNPTPVVPTAPSPEGEGKRNEMGRIPKTLALMAVEGLIWKATAT